jgi:hypothetical protein
VRNASHSTTSIAKSSTFCLARVKAAAYGGRNLPTQKQRTIACQHGGGNSQSISPSRNRSFPPSSNPTLTSSITRHSILTNSHQSSILSQSAFPKISSTISGNSSYVTPPLPTGIGVNFELIPTLSPLTVLGSTLSPLLYE